MFILFKKSCLICILLIIFIRLDGNVFSSYGYQSSTTDVFNNTDDKAPGKSGLQAKPDFLIPGVTKQLKDPLLRKVIKGCNNVNTI
jgi:hypothetical protein